MADKNFKITVDMDQSSAIPSKGMHVALTKDAEVKDNKAQDGQNLVLTFEIQTKGEKGRRVVLYQSLKSTVAWRYSQVLAAYGFTGSAATVTRKDLVGKLVKVQISHEDWQGEDRARVDRVLPHVSANGKKAAKAAKPEEPEEPDEPDEDEDEGEDEEQEAPKPKKKAKRKAKKKQPEPEPEPEDDDEDDDIDDDDDDDDDDPELDAPF